MFGWIKNLAAKAWPSKPAVTLVPVDVEPPYRGRIIASLPPQMPPKITITADGPATEVPFVRYRR